MSIGSRKIFKKKHRGKKKRWKQSLEKRSGKKDAKKDAKKRCVLTTFVKKILFHRLAEQNLSEHIIIGHHLPTDFRAVFCSIQCAKGSPPFFEVHKLWKMCTEKTLEKLLWKKRLKKRLEKNSQKKSEKNSEKKVENLAGKRWTIPPPKQNRARLFACGENNVFSRVHRTI